MRYSHQRESIYHTVLESNDHPTANMVYDALKAEQPHLSLGTVYRNLNQLADAGRLRKIPLPDGGCRFDGTIKPHSHVVCDRCGEVEDVSLPLVQGVGREIEKETGYRLTSRDIVVHGVCPHCQTDA